MAQGLRNLESVTLAGTDPSERRLVTWYTPPVWAAAMPQEAMAMRARTRRLPSFLDFVRETDGLFDGARGLAAWGSVDDMCMKASLFLFCRWWQKACRSGRAASTGARLVSY
jgi:hypothetical protein